MKSKLSRKDFLTLAWKSVLAMSGLLGLGGLFRFLGYLPDPAPQTVFDLGTEDDFSPGSKTIIPDAQAIILREGNTFSALSLVCSHLGCQVELVPEGFACPCHGSHFDPNGNVLRGPADQPLRALRLEQKADGTLILNTKGD